MSTNFVNKSTGELITIASGTRIWIGSQSAHDTAEALGKLPNNCLVAITDVDTSDDSDWKTLNANVKYIKRKGVVYVNVNSGNITTSANAGYNYGTLPEGYRPSITLTTGMSGYGASPATLSYNACQQWLRVETTGNVQMVSGLSNTTYTETHGYISFPVLS